LPVGQWTGIIPVILGPDPPAGWRAGLACNAYAVLPGLINNIEIAIFAKEVAPGRAGQAIIPLFQLWSEAELSPICGKKSKIYFLAILILDLLSG